MLPVFTTDAARSDPVFGLAPAEFPALQWHADTFALPAGAIRLAHSAAYPEQAFVVARAYALQFHLEIDAARAAAWGEVPAYAHSLRELLGDDALPRLAADVERRERVMTELARRLFAAWLERVVGLEPVAAGAYTAR